MVLPVAWVVDNKPVLVVGAGSVGESRVSKLLEADARVFVVSPEATDQIQRWSHTNRIVWLKELWNHDHLKQEQWEMVLTAIPDRDLSLQIAEECRRQRINVNAADIPSHCDFYFGANRRHGPLNVMISSSGSSPRLTAKLLANFERMLDKHHVVAAIENVGQMRRRLRELIPDPAASRVRMNLMKTFCDKMSFEQLAALSPDQMEGLVQGAFLATVASPNNPIGDIPDAQDSFDDC